VRGRADGTGTFSALSARLVTIRVHLAAISEKRIPARSRRSPTRLQMGEPSG
jgi:hypothetical protein